MSLKEKKTSGNGQMDRITMILKKKLIRGVSLTLPWGYIHVYKFSGLRLAFTGPLVLWFEYEFRLIDRFTDEASIAKMAYPDSH